MKEPKKYKKLLNTKEKEGMFHLFPGFHSSFHKIWPETLGGGYGDFPSGDT